MKYLIILLLILCGCTTSYKHMSNPSVRNDGYELICGGVEVGEQWQASVDLCSNTAAYGGEFVIVELQYNWKK